MKSNTITKPQSKKTTHFERERYFYKHLVDMNQVVYHYTEDQKKILLSKLLENLFKTSAEELAMIAQIFEDSRGENCDASKVFDKISNYKSDHKLITVLKH